LFSPDRLSYSSLTAIGLAMDCTAVAAAYGMTVRTGRMRVLIKLSATFGFFQALLFVSGWALGLGLRDLIGRYDHWIAFILLSVIGGKMIFESFHGSGGERAPELTWMKLVVLGVATSIDAMAVGLGFAVVGGSIMGSALLVAGFSALLPAAGFLAVGKLGGGLGKWAERFGGAVLIGLGLKTLITHLLLRI
jgi:putative Mn2+ efflux pump MntP